MEKTFLPEERLYRGNQEKLQERKSNPAKGKEVATRSSNTVRGGELNIGY
jgi:hypothetical protein